MKKHSFLTAFLGLVLIFSMLLGSCAKGPEPPVVPPEAAEDPEAGDPPEAEDTVTEALKRNNLIAYVYRQNRIKIGYVLTSATDLWRNADFDKESLGVSYNPNRTDYREWKESDYPLEPGDKVVIEETIYYSSVNVSPQVYDFIESWDVSKKQFLICNYEDMTTISEESKRLFEEKCKTYFPGAVAIEGTNYFLWENTADALVRIAELELRRVDVEEFQCLICFPEEFYNLYGVTVEQAQTLIKNGHLNMQCKAPIGSPLYGLTPAEIAAYLAEHLEILE